MRSVVWWWLVVTACTPVQPQPSYYSQQQPYGQQPYPQQQQPYEQPYPQQPTANGTTCSQVVACYLGSTTQDSINACETNVDPSVVSASRAVVECSSSSQCRDAACLERSCAIQLSTCNWHPPANAQAQVSQPAPAPVNQPAPVAATPGHARVLVGLKPLGSGGGYRQTRRWGWYVLFDDGRYFTSLPLTGLYGADASKLPSPGSYVDRGNRIETSATDSTSPMSFERQPDGTWSGDTTYTMVDSMDNAVLEGAYARLGYGRTKTGAAPDLAFSRDGRFNANQFYVSDGSLGTGSRIVPAGTGTYRILQNTLMLTYSTGQTIWLSIVALQANELPRPTDLFIAGEQYQSP